MKILYLTWGDTPRSYGIFGSQVVDQFLAIADQNSENEYYMISGVPIVHSGLLREKWSYFSEVDKIKKRLKKIKFDWITIWCTQNFVNSTKFGFKLMHGLAHKRLHRKIIEIMPDVVHCRSYHAAWAALVVKKKYDLNYKIIFDARGLWPEEVALKKGWDENSSNFKFLKKIEKNIIDACDCSISVSDTMHQYFISLGSKIDHVIYLSADAKKLKVNLDDREKSKYVRFCYVGALSEGTWHKPQNLAELYGRIRNLLPGSKLTIVTTSNKREFLKYFREYSLDEVSVTSVKTRDELKNILKKQDIGLMSYFIPNNKRELLLARMVLAVKTAEYLVAGLPMICSKYCGGASDLIDLNGLGLSYDPENLSCLNQGDIEKLLSYDVKKNCIKFSENNFDYIVNGHKYMEVYKNYFVQDLNVK